WIMLAGFLVLGGCTVAFGAALHEALSTNATGGAGPGPALIQGAGLLTVAAGPLRCDHLLLNAPVSRARPGITTRMTRSVACSTTTDVTGPAAAILRRAAVTLPQAAVAAIADRLMRRRPAG
ncbi:MAG: hypothetical protein ACRDOH_14520, partial [Streptosporangiaceae bacterium]